MAEQSMTFGQLPGQPTTPFVAPHARELEIWLCWECGNYKPLTSEDYQGGLTGDCSVCKKRVREVHRFSVRLDINGVQCNCWMSHERRSAA